MNLKRAFIIGLAACILPGVSMAQTGAEARFLVTKNFTDNNPASVTVNLECNDGFVSQDGTAEITEDGIGHTFIVTGLTDLSEVVCEVTEGGMAGYTTRYTAASNATDNEEQNNTSCLYVFPAREQVQDLGKAGDEVLPADAVRMGTMNYCEIRNRPDWVEIKVSKDWDITNSGGNVIDFWAAIDVVSDRALDGGGPCPASSNDKGCLTLYFTGENPADQTVSVRPKWSGTNVYFSEEVADSYVETEDSCDGMVKVVPGDTGESCAFTNSVFFEGIPTLSQYGMAIMALLMLGVGFVGFRRFI